MTKIFCLKPHIYISVLIGFLAVFPFVKEAPASKNTVLFKPYAFRFNRNEVELFALHLNSEATNRRSILVQDMMDIAKFTISEANKNGHSISKEIMSKKDRIYRGILYKGQGREKYSWVKDYKMFFGRKHKKDGTEIAKYKSARRVAMYALKHYRGHTTYFDHYVSIDHFKSPELQEWARNHIREFRIGASHVYMKCDWSLNSTAKYKDALLELQNRS